MNIVSKFHDLAHLSELMLPCIRGFRTVNCLTHTRGLETRAKLCAGSWRSVKWLRRVSWIVSTKELRYCPRIEMAISMIPKILHFVWVGGKSLPERYVENMRRWKEHHPDWEHRLWTNVPIDAEWRWIVACETRPVQIADILRVEMVFRHGGVYADLDSWPVQSIGPTIEGLDSFVVRNYFGNIDNYIFGATKNHPWLKKVLGKVWFHYRPNERIGLMGGNLFVRTNPHTYPRYREFRYGILSARPNDEYAREVVVFHSEDNSWRKSDDRK